MDNAPFRRSRIDVDSLSQKGLITPQCRARLPPSSSCPCCAPAAAMVGGAQTAPKFAHAVVMLAGQRGFCSGTAIARDLVLTAAHCVLPGTDYKLVVFEARRQALAQVDRDASRGIRSSTPKRCSAIAPPPTSRCSNSLQTVSTAPVPLGPAGTQGRRRRPFLVAGYGLATPGDGQQRRHRAHRDAGRDRPARHAADPPDGSRDQERARRARRLCRRFRRRRCSPIPAARSR